MEIAKGLKVPFKPDSVLCPELHYGDPFPGLYFRTDDDQYGRITFENLDSLKVSRGEFLPFENDWKEGDSYNWVYIVNDSKWLSQRHKYESDHYGDSYEFDGNVDDMLTEFNHYVFCFHDEFVEAIARGIWFEKDSESLFRKELQNDHPFLPLSNKNVIKFEAHGLTCHVKINPKNIDELKSNSIFCSQTLMEFSLQFGEQNSVANRLILLHRKNDLICYLRGYFGKKQVAFNNIPTLDEVKPYIETYMAEVQIRRKKMSKKSEK